MSAPLSLPTRMRDRNGLFSMVAVDQRESLRAMLARSGELPVTDERMRRFKVEVAGALSPVASALLVDIDFGLQPILEADVLADGCDLIVALDAIHYDERGVPQATRLRRDLLGASWDKRVAGFKFLVLWTPEEWLGCRPENVREFIEEAARAGVDSVLEVVVREADGSTPTPERQAELVLAAAKQTAPLGATLYKAEVPFRNLASEEDVVGASRQITEAVTSPWVVLSSGVPADQFPEAVARTARGGAEGFLAGRAIWSNATALTGAAMTDYLTSQSVDTLAGLRESLRLGAAHSTCS